MMMSLKLELPSKVLPTTTKGLLAANDGVVVILNVAALG